MQELLLFFTRYPVAGRVKTRLIPALGAAGAAELQRRLSERTCEQLRLAAARRSAAWEIRYTGGNRRQVAAWLPGAHRYRPQGGGDLGARLARAVSAGLAADYDRIVVVGGDCPGLTAAHLVDALERLADYDLVLGPALDGGYYLLGLAGRVARPPGESGAAGDADRPPWTELFAGISWGTEEVLAQTLARAAGLHLTFTTLEPLADVDRPADLVHLGDYTRP